MTETDRDVARLIAGLCGDALYSCFTLALKMAWTPHGIGGASQEHAPSRDIWHLPVRLLLALLEPGRGVEVVHQRVPEQDGEQHGPEEDEARHDVGLQLAQIVAHVLGRRGGRWGWGGRRSACVQQRAPPGGAGGAPRRLRSHITAAGELSVDRPRGCPHANGGVHRCMSHPVRTQPLDERRELVYLLSKHREALVFGQRLVLLAATVYGGR
mmetsp:Transcript_24521/g.61096  ORF Transcript_24521/g.61096 Transcript_24521/m.61096 type:complete len:212 (+) Transcript_24521:304-939(+)